MYRRMSLVTMVVAALAVLSTASVSQAVLFVDQEQTLGSNGGYDLGGSNTHVAQGFVPSVNTIWGVMLNLHNVTNPGNFDVGIYNVVDPAGDGTQQDDNEPTGAALVSVTVHTSTINPDSVLNEEILFTSPLALTPGNRYAIQITQTGGAGGFPTFSIFREQATNNYGPGDFVRQQGGSWSHFANNDLTFQTLWFPEPASLALLGLGGLMMIRRRR